MVGDGSVGKAPSCYDSRATGIVEDPEWLVGRWKVWLDERNDVIGQARVAAAGAGVVACSHVSFEHALAIHLGFEKVV